MSKPVKNMIIEMYRNQFAGVNDAVLVDIRGIDANSNNALRLGLAKTEVKLTVVKNNLAQKAFEGSGLEGLGELIDGPTTVAYGGESVVNVARDLIDWAKQVGGLEFKGAIMEGTLFGPDQVTALSKYPTRDEAQSQVVQVVVGAAGQLISSLTSSGNDIAGILKTMEEKLEGGEAISKAS
jgi:large subunit ribosomal protein L10